MELRSSFFLSPVVILRIVAAVIAMSMYSASWLPHTTPAVLCVLGSIILLFSWQRPKVVILGLLCFVAAVAVIRAEGSDAILFPEAYIAPWRAALAGVVAAHTSADSAALLVGMTIGEVLAFPRDLKEAFRSTGTSHLLAVSGYNVALTVTACASLLKAVGVPRRATTVLLAGAMCAFAAVAGGKPPVMRAAVMGMLTLWARVSGRRPDAINLFLAGLALLLFLQPQQRTTISFLLSFSAVAGLFWLSTPIHDWLERVAGARRLPVIAKQALADSLAATLTTLPLTIGVFGTLPVHAPLVNMVVAPLVPWATISGAVTLGVAGIWPGLVSWVTPISSVPTELLTLIVRTAARFPVVLVGGVFPPLAAVVWYGVLLLVVRSAQRHPCQNGIKKL